MTREIPKSRRQQCRCRWRGPRVLMRVQSDRKLGQSRESQVKRLLWSVYNTNVYLRRCHVIHHVIWLEKWVETHYSMCPPLNMATSTSPKNVEQSKRSKRKNM